MVKLKCMLLWISVLMFTQIAQANTIEFTKKVDFDVGNEHATEYGFVKGHNKTNYQFYGNKGDKVSIRLESVGAYFKLYSPIKRGVDAPLFTIKTEGTSYTGILSKSGLYTIEIYLGHKESREDEKVIYTLHIDRTH